MMPRKASKRENAGLSSDTEELHPVQTLANMQVHGDSATKGREMRGAGDTGVSCDKITSDAPVSRGEHIADEAIQQVTDLWDQESLREAALMRTTIFVDEQDCQEPPQNQGLLAGASLNNGGSFTEAASHAPGDTAVVTDSTDHPVPTHTTHTNTNELQSVIINAVANLGQIVQAAVLEVKAGVDRLAHASDSVHITQPTASAAQQHLPVCSPTRRSRSAQPQSPRQSRRCNRMSRSSSTSDDGSDSNSMIGSSRYTRTRSSSTRLPPFTGKESWRVWFNRFDEVATRLGWSRGKRLDELLPRLQGPAGEFVFDQLDHECRCSYSSLVKELESRFRVVETKKTYAAILSHRNQKPGECVEDYAAELKKLYSKAHPHRDSQTRQEDLLRRFFDGLSDEKARVQVEYVKDPKSIDEAVDAVVAYMEACKPSSTSGGERRQRPARQVQMVAPAPDDEDEDEDALPPVVNSARLTRQGANKSAMPNNKHANRAQNKSDHVGQQKPNGSGISDACLAAIAELKAEIAKKRSGCP